MRLLLLLFAAAQPAEASLRLSGEVNAVSDYRYRGISRSGEEAALQGNLHVAHGSGAYAGVWGSSLREQSRLGDAELNFYAGYDTDIASGTTIDGGLLYYAFPDSRDGASDYFEPYAKLSHSLGPARATIGAAYAWDQRALADSDNLYLWTDLSAGIPTTPLTIKAHVGRSDGGLTQGRAYVDWSLSAEAAFGALTVGAAYVDTDLGALRDADGGVILSLGFAF